MAKTRSYYFRHAEASGITMVDEGGVNGIYSPSSAVPNTAIYTGGPTCMLADTNYGVAANASGLTQFSLFTVVSFNALTGIRPLPCADQSSGFGRKYQWRTNGDAMEFVKIEGGVAVVAQAGVFTVGVPMTIGLTVSATGDVNFYAAGSNIKNATVAAADYSGGDAFTIGGSVGIGAAADAYFSETVLSPTVFSAGDYAAFAAAAGC
jgi:hypothetical protein